MIMISPVVNRHLSHVPSRSTSAYTVLNSGVYPFILTTSGTASPQQYVPKYNYIAKQWASHGTDRWTALWLEWVGKTSPGLPEQGSFSEGL